MTTTTTMTPSSPPSSEQLQSPTHLTSLQPLVTDSTVKRPSYQRSSSSFAKNRLSTHSNVSFASQSRSRPGSHVFPIFHSSLPYALVRDFAYPSVHPLHYGPLPPRASAVSTPVSEQRRLSDPPAPWDSSRGQWSTQPWTTENGFGHQHQQQQLPAMSFGDGPPYSEDEDLHSPVFTTSRHRKNKSTGAESTERRGRSPGRSVPSRYFAEEPDRGTLVSMNADGSETYYVNDDDADEDGPGGEYVTYAADESRYAHLMTADPYGNQGRYAGDAGFDSEDDDRYSRDFQFAVGCPDEEMHGKAVALFDFAREHENELPLVEGQVIFVSYRHGEGWLVAEDPKSGESGLVPEEFVRLLRDIEGGLTSLNDETGMTEVHADAMAAGPESTADLQQGQSGEQESTNTDKSLNSEDSNDTTPVASTTGEDAPQPPVEQQPATSEDTSKPSEDPKQANSPTKT